MSRPSTSQQFLTGVWGKFWWVVWIYSVLTPRVRGPRASWTFLFRARRCGWFYVALRHLWSNIVTTSQVSAGDFSLTVFATSPRVLLGVTYPLPITHYHTSGSVCVWCERLYRTHTHTLAPVQRNRTGKNSFDTKNRQLNCAFKTTHRSMRQSKNIGDSVLPWRSSV